MKWLYLQRNGVVVIVLSLMRYCKYIGLNFVLVVNVHINPNLKPLKHIYNKSLISITTAIITNNYAIIINTNYHNPNLKSNCILLESLEE